MAGHSRSKNGNRFALAYVPAIHIFGSEVAPWMRIPAENLWEFW
jgi:hypothetical protein